MTAPGSDFQSPTLPAKASPAERAAATAYARRHCPDLLAMLGLDDDAPSAPSSGSRRADYARRVRRTRTEADDAQRGAE